jgi:hypothetical protein
MPDTEQTRKRPALLLDQLNSFCDRIGGHGATRRRGFRAELLRKHERQSRQKQLAGLVHRRAYHDFAPGLVGTFQDSEAGAGRHASPPRFFALGSEPQTSCLIGQPLAFRAFDGAIGALQIVDAEGDSVVEPEIELGGVAMQMRLANMEIGAVDAAFEDREEVPTLWSKLTPGYRSRPDQKS